MMERPLLLSCILEHGVRRFGHQEIVSREADGAVTRRSFADLGERCRRLAGALVDTLGVAMGDCVATMAWTTHRHLELYFALPGIGAVCHTLNPRYSDAQLVYILNHVGNRLAFVAPDLAERLRALQPQCPQLERLIVLDAEYDALVEATAPLTPWPEFDERSGCSLCFTSGSTGAPKGVLYSHRSITLYALGGIATGANGMGPEDCALMCVPMFHVNGWSKPFQAMITGAKMVLPGPQMDGASLQDLIADERATTAYGVPTIWLGYFEHLEKTGRGPGSLRRIGFGGGAPPKGLLRACERHGLTFSTGYGMTETVAGIGLGNHAPDLEKAEGDARLDLFRAHRPMFGIEAEARDADGAPLPADGRATGELVLRGNFIVGEYFDDPAATAAAFTEDGWFRSGDTVSFDRFGRLRITDRIKDLVKSGGEWISSLELESAASTHAAVAEAAVIGLPHPKWAERPLMLLRLKPGATLDAEDLRAHLAEAVPKWWLPDAMECVESIPRNATGKPDKLALRQRHAGWHYDESGALRRPARQ